MKFFLKMLAVFIGTVLALVFATSADAITCSTPPCYPTTAASNNTAGTIPWVNPGNILTDNGSNSQTTLTTIANQSYYLLGTNFQFNIPTTSTVLGIKAEIKKQTGLCTIGANIRDAEVTLWKDPFAVGSNKATAANWPLTMQYVTYGGATDLWGTTWTASEINSPTFGVAVRARDTANLTCRALVDTVRLTVYYSVPQEFNVSWLLPLLATTYAATECELITDGPTTTASCTGKAEILNVSQDLWNASILFSITFFATVILISKRKERG